MEVVALLLSMVWDGNKCFVALPRVYEGTYKWSVFMTDFDLFVAFTWERTDRYPNVGKKNKKWKVKWENNIRELEPKDLVTTLELGASCFLNLFFP